MRKIFTKLIGLLVSVSFASSISMVSSGAVSPETEKLTQGMKNLWSLQIKDISKKLVI